MRVLCRAPCLLWCAVLTVCCAVLRCAVLCVSFRLA